MNNNGIDPETYNKFLQFMQQQNMNNPNMNMNNMMNNKNMFYNKNMMFNPGMNNFMNMNNTNQNQSQGQNNGQDWTLYFVRKYDNNKITIQINSGDTVASAISRYKIKSLEEIPLIFTYNGKPLNSQLSLSASGLQNNATITVEKGSNQFSIPNQAPQRFWIFIFEKKGENKPVSVQVEASKKVKDAIKSYKSKVNNFVPTMIFIFNSKTLNEEWTMSQAGLRDNSKILVITTGDIEGAN
jgi:hypothetical protein